MIKIVLCIKKSKNINNNKTIKSIIISFDKIKMGYNSRCTFQTCTQGCCNYYGTCPNPSSSSTFYRNCYYYYNSNTTTKSSGGTVNLDGGGIAGVVVGVVGGVIILVLVIVCSIMKCRKNANNDHHCHQATQQTTLQTQPNVMNTTTTEMGHQFSDPALMFNQPYAQPYGQPQPYVQPPPAFNQPAYLPADNGFQPSPFLNQPYPQMPDPMYNQMPNSIQQPFPIQTNLAPQPNMAQQPNPIIIVKK
mgnify:CR=1 FL=1|jgi:hypothetical protein